MSGIIVKRIASRVAVFSTVLACLVAGTLSGAVHADSAAEIEALRAQLEEAKLMLEQDSASFQETQEKKRAIDALLEDRKAREAEIREEVKQLCEAHDKLNPGSFDQCMQKLGS